MLVFIFLVFGLFVQYLSLMSSAAVCWLQSHDSCYCGSKRFDLQTREYGQSSLCDRCVDHLDSHAFLTKEHLISSSCLARLSFQPWVFQHPRAPKHPRLEAGPNDQLTGALLVICTKRAILLALILY